MDFHEDKFESAFGHITVYLSIIIQSGASGVSFQMTTNKYDNKTFNPSRSSIEVYLLRSLGHYGLDNSHFVSYCISRVVNYLDRNDQEIARDTLGY